MISKFYTFSNKKRVVYSKKEDIRVNLANFNTKVNFYMILGFENKFLAWCKSVCVAVKQLSCQHFCFQWKFVVKITGLLKLEAV